MSKKLYQRGRYPKNSTFYNNPVIQKQESPAATTSSIPYMQCSPDVPLYNQQANQSIGSPWQQHPNHQQQQQAYYSGQEPIQSPYLPPQESWHDGSTYCTSRPPENNVWNWMPENNSGNTNSINNNRNTAIQSQYPQHQGNLLPSTSQVNPMPSSAGNIETLGVYDHSSVGQPANSTYGMQNDWCQQNMSDSSNQNGNQYNNSVYQQEQSGWEALSQPLSQPAHLPWTYSVPQTLPPPPMSQSISQWPSVDLTNSSTTEAKNIELFGVGNSASNQISQADTGQNNLQHAISYLQPTNDDSQVSSFVYPPTVNQCVDQQSYLGDSNLENLESCNSTVANEICSSDVQEIAHEIDPESGAISAFFNHSTDDQSVINPNDEKNVGSAQMTVENICGGIETSNESPVVHNCETRVTQENAEDINEQYQTIQGQNDSSYEEGVTFPPSDAPNLAIEEPLNQEVPEPNDLSLYNSSTSHSANQPNDDQSPDDHLNQQVPAERVVTQESQSQKLNTKPHSNENSAIQEVNLETVPDNLERPPDHEELKKHSSWHSLHRHHLRDDHENKLSLSSTSLWDSPDLPHITLVPAVPTPSISAPPSNAENNSSQLITNEKPSSENLSESTENPEVTAVPQSSSEISSQNIVKSNPSSDILIIPNKEESSSENMNICDTSRSSQECVEQVSSHDRHSPSHDSKSPLSVSSDSPQSDSKKHRETYSEDENDKRKYEKDAHSRYYHKNVHSRYYDKESGNERYYGDNMEREKHVKASERGKYRDKDVKAKYHTRDSEKERHRKYIDSDEFYDRDRYDDKYHRRIFDDEGDFEHYQSYERYQERDPRYERHRDYENQDMDPRPNRKDASNRPPTTESGSSRSLGYQNDFVDKNGRYRYEEERFRNIDQRTYPSGEGSRPSSRMSLNEPLERHPFREIGYQKSYMSDNERPSSRMSESEALRSREAGNHPYYDRRYRDTYQRDEDYYRRNRGYPGYDYDPYQMSGYQYYGYYDPYQQNYSRYNYGYYDELYRNDPRQQVDEQYRDYYKRMGYETDAERSSVHSGRSSVTEMSKETSQRYPDNDASAEIPYNQQLYGYSERPSQFSSFDVSDDQLNASTARLTPAKFTCAHAFANFSADGKLITVLPKQSGYDASSFTPFVQIHDMQVLMQDLESSKELKKFPGPLVRGESHKGDLIEFCQSKVKLYKQKEGIPDRDSYVLLWELLVLLLRQNGSVAGSDIAELLLKDHEVLHKSQFKSNLDTPSEDSSPVDAGDAPSIAHSGDTSSPDEGIFVAQDRTVLNTSQKMDVDKVTRKFREFLLYGHKKDALEWAMKYGLWGHALFLASKMDLRTYANIMTRFANSLAINDPLQTLYQLMSGRQPAAVTCVADKNWGDWRPHLAMILSNPSTHAEVDSKSITTLGDTLAAQGCLPAAHFCYLMSQVDFGCYSQKSSKLVLLGADHRLPFKEFATNEAIQCTEIYEYAQSLANPGFILNHFQGYKFIYTTRLLDHGYFHEALHYCEVLASGVTSNLDPSLVNLTSQVYELSCRLKYYDPHYLQGQGELTEQEDPEWISELSDFLKNLKQGNLEARTGEHDEMTHIERTAENNFNEVAEVTTPNQLPETPNVTYYTPHSQQFYQQSSMWPSNDPGSSQQLPSQLLLAQQQIEVKQQPSDIVANQYQHDAPSTHWNQNIQSSQEHSNLDLQQQQYTPAAPTSYATSPTQNYKRFDFYSTEPHQAQGIKATNKERTNSTSSLGFQRDRHDSTVSSGSDYAAGRSNTSSRKASDVIKEEKTRPQVGRSWLGGIFSRLLPKGPNQMILPDDKNPTIVWDPVTKKWVNMDSNDEDEASQPAAPPTDSELMRQGSVDSSSNVPVASAAAPSMPIPPVPTVASSPPTVNKFQRPKVKAMRQNYVDVLGQSVTTTKPVPPPEMLFPSMMPMQQNPTNMFIPSASVSEDAPVDFVSSGQAASQSALEDDPEAAAVVPPMFDPAEFNSRRSSMSSTRHSVGTTRRTYPT